jgi:hypothetical protein
VDEECPGMFWDVLRVPILHYIFYSEHIVDIVDIILKRNVRYMIA